jgi:hypothetical protein
MQIKISTGVKRKIRLNNGREIPKETYYVNVFKDFQGMKDGKPIFSITADNFPSLTDFIKLVSYKFSYAKASSYTLHNGWKISQTTQRMENGLCLDKAQYNEINVVLHGIIRPSKELLYVEA